MVRIGTLLLVFAVACGPSDEDRRRKQHAEDLDQNVALLRTETSRQLRRHALGAVMSYCQKKSMEAACDELKYQLVWGGRSTADDLAADPTIGLDSWAGKVAAPFWRVAYEAATTEDGKRVLRMIWLRARGEE